MVYIYKKDVHNSTVIVAVSLPGNQTGSESNILIIINKASN